MNVGNMIKEGLNYLLENFLFEILFKIETYICRGVGYMQQLFDVFTGTAMVSYDNSDSYLINVFFGNKAIAGVYWGMAAIGIVLSFIFAVTAVIRKMFDLDEKVKHTFGQILTGLLKSILIILSLNVAMTVVITSTNVLMKSVNNLFDEGQDIADGSPHIDFTNEQYAAMSRIFNTVGNYSLNPSYLSRYNLNACYNEIRSDLKYLSDTGMFNYDYEEPETEGGKYEVTWQSVLQELALAGDFNTEVAVDVYNEGIANAVGDCMKILKTDSGFHALESFDRKNRYDKNKIDMGRMLFVIGTMGVGNTAAARNEVFNEKPSLYDNLRKPYLLGVKDAYDLQQVNKDFSITASKMNYLVIYLAGTTILGVMALIVLNCIVRIFNLLFMYLIAPPIIAISPLDDGGKFRQWLTAFIVQAFSIFATVISMRLYLLFVPIIMSPSLEISSLPFLNMLAKVVIIVAAAQAVLKANGILTGILSDQAGMQSIYAGDMSDYAKSSSTVGRAALAAKEWLDAAPGKAALLPVKGVGKLFSKKSGGGSGGGGNSDEKLPDNKTNEKKEDTGNSTNTNNESKDTNNKKNSQKDSNSKKETELPGKQKNKSDGGSKGGKGAESGKGSKKNSSPLPSSERNKPFKATDKQIKNLFGEKGLEKSKGQQQGDDVPPKDGGAKAGSKGNKGKSGNRKNLPKNFQELFKGHKGDGGVSSQDVPELLRKLDAEALSESENQKDVDTFFADYADKHPQQAEDNNGAENPVPDNQHNAPQAKGDGAATGDEGSGENTGDRKQHRKKGKARKNADNMFKGQKSRDGSAEPNIPEMLRNGDGKGNNDEEEVDAFLREYADDHKPEPSKQAKAGGKGAVKSQNKENKREKSPVKQNKKSSAEKQSELPKNEANNKKKSSGGKGNKNPSAPKGISGKGKGEKRPEPNIPKPQTQTNKTADNTAAKQPNNSPKKKQVSDATISNIFGKQGLQSYKMNQSGQSGGGKTGNNDKPKGVVRKPDESKNEPPKKEN